MNGTEGGRSLSESDGIREAAPRISRSRVQRQQQINSTLAYDLIVICRPCCINKRLNTHPALSKRDSVCVSFSASHSRRLFSPRCIVYQ
jgi:hypothetical protein